ncbi:MAG: phytoene/squalene synthase family protein [Acidimicrobiales bacterium]
MAVGRTAVGRMAVGRTAVGRMARTRSPLPLGGGEPSASPVGLEDSYRRCRQLAKAYGRTYYLATWLLPRVKRHHVHALYGFCRYADDIVDDLGPAPVPERAAALHGLGERFFSDLEAGRSEDPVLKAVVHTARAFAIDPHCFRRFLGAMAMDLSVSSYETFDDLCAYMDGSAAVIGEMMLPILEPSGPQAEAAARDLGIAFQLTNFIRDVGEDLGRGRTYLPQVDLRRFGAEAALAERRVDPRWAELLAFEIGRARSYYARADQGIGLLPPSSARCVRGARILYSQILDRVEANGYDVFSRRARVAAVTKAGVATRVALNAW